MFYWDATWTGAPGNPWDPTNPGSGNAWENQAMFDFNDLPLPALAEFKTPDNANPAYNFFPSTSKVAQ